MQGNWNEYDGMEEEIEKRLKRMRYRKEDPGERKRERV